MEDEEIPTGPALVAQPATDLPAAGDGQAGRREIIFVFARSYPFAAWCEGAGRNPFSIVFWLRYYWFSATIFALYKNRESRFATGFSAECRPLLERSAGLLADFLLQSLGGALEHHLFILCRSARGLSVSANSLAGASSFVSLGFLLYGVNDIVDAEADRLNPRREHFCSARGAADQLAATMEDRGHSGSFSVVFFVLTGPRILFWFATLLLAVVLYNAPRFGWKSHPPFDVLIQASYLLIFMLSSWLNGVHQLPWQTFLFGALFAMHSHVFGEVMDMEPDWLSGRRTTATFLGAVPSKLLIAAFLCVETGLVYVFFDDLVIAGFLGFGAAWFLLDAMLIWKNRSYSPTEMRLFMWGWNAASLLGMYWNWAHGSLTQVRHAAGP